MLGPGLVEAGQQTNISYPVGKDGPAPGRAQNMKNKIFLVMKHWHLTGENETFIYQSKDKARARFEREIMDHYGPGADNSRLDQGRVYFLDGTEADIESLDLGADFGAFVRDNLARISSIWADDGEMFGEISFQESAFEDEEGVFTPAQAERAAGNVWVK